MKPPLSSTPEERAELHREKMRNKRARRDRWHQQVLGDIERRRKQYGEAIRGNHADRGPKAEHRNAIWPVGKTAKPGRMA